MNGNINLRVDLGRILLMGPCQSGLRMEALLSVLNPHFAEGDNVLFTKIITRNRSDVEDIVNTKDVEGKPMWLPAAAVRIIYQFACMANEDMFFVDVGDSSSQLTYTIRKKRPQEGCHLHSCHASELGCPALRGAIPRRRYEGEILVICQGTPQQRGSSSLGR
jgi:hypothetical protein